MTDIAELEVRINPGDASASIDELLRGMRRLEDQQDDIQEGQRDLRDSTQRLSDGFDTLKGAIAGVVGGLSIAFFVDTARAMDELSARVRTATDSLEQADFVMRSLQQVARDTPLTLDELTFSYQKLANQGIEVTAKQLEGLGALAVVMGRELEDSMDAVRDAILFNAFDPLEEFGIFAEEQGDKIAVTFQGMTKEIENSTESILGYLSNLGNSTFGDAFENQMDGVNGAMLDLERAMAAVSKTGATLLAPFIEGIARDLAGLLDTANAVARALFNISPAARDLTEQIDAQRASVLAAAITLERAQKVMERVREEQGESSKRFRELQYNVEGAQLAYDQQVKTLQALGQEYVSLKPKLEQVTGSSGGGSGGGGGSGMAGAADAAKKLDTELQQLLKTSMQLAAIREGLAADIGGTLVDRLGQEISSGQVAEIEAKLEAMGETIGLDFAKRFWDVFANQGKFTLESLVGTFQAWGLELAQSQVFDDLFANLKTSLGKEMSGLLGAGLAGFGVGGTAGNLAGGGTAGLLAGIGGGALTGGYAGGPVGAIVGGVLGGLGAALGGGSGSPDQYGFSVSGGLGALAGAGGPGQGDFSRFLQFINELETSIAATFGPGQLGNIQRALEDFRSAEIRMAEGGFEAERAMALVTDRLAVVASGLGTGFGKLFQALEDGTSQGVAEAVESLLAIRRAMDAFGINLSDTRNLLDEAAVYGETYADTLARIAGAQATLEAALYTSEERQQQSLENAKQRIDEFNESLGLTGDEAIDTREELRAYNDSLDLNRKSSHDAYLELLNVSDAFRDVFEAAESAAPAIEDTAEAINEIERETFDLGNVIDDIVRLLNDYVQWQYRLAEAINATTGAMAGWELALQQTNDTVALFNIAVASGASVEQQLQLFNQAFSQFQNAYNQAMQQIANDLQNRIAEIRDEYADLIEQEREAFDLRREALQSELDITRAWASTLSSVEGIISGLESGALSPFGPSGQFAIGQSNLAALQAQYAGSSGAQRAALGAQLAQALQAQLGLAGGLFGIGSNQYLEEYNDTIQQLTAIQEEAAAEAARQSELEQALVDLQQEQTDRIAQLNQQMADEIQAAENHAQDQVDTVNQFAAGVYAEFERVGNRLYSELLEQRLQQAELEAEGREIQAAQLQVLIDIREGFIAAGLVERSGMARVAARNQRYL